MIIIVRIAYGLDFYQRWSQTVDRGARFHLLYRARAYFDAGGSRTGRRVGALTLPKSRPGLVDATMKSRGTPAE